MLIPCPECKTEVSEMAPTCPKCGAVIAYPPFYSCVGRQGLNVSSLVVDWYNQFQDDSALGAGLPIECLSRYFPNEEMALLTWKTGGKIMEAMESRRMQLPKQSREVIELKIAIDYVMTVRDFANVTRCCSEGERKWSPDKIRANLNSILRRLELLKASSDLPQDIKFFDSEAVSLKSFAENILAQPPVLGKSAGPPSPPPQNHGKGRGCLPLLIFVAVAVLAGAWWLVQRTLL